MLPIVFQDGFKHLQLNNLAVKWDPDSTLPTSFIPSRLGGQGVRFFNSTGVLKHSEIPDQSWSMAFGFRVSRGGAQSVIARVRDGILAQLELCLNSNGTLSVKRSGTVIATSPKPIPTVTWVFIEWQFLIDNLFGSTKVNVSGKPFITSINVNTQNSPSSNVGVFTIGPDTPATDVYYDYSDFILSQGLQFLGQMGDVSVQTIMMRGPGLKSQWIPSGQPTNWESVSQINSDLDTSGVSSAPDADEDLYTPGSVGASLKILSVQDVIVAKGTDVSLATLLSDLDGNETQGALQVIGDDYATLVTPFLQNPYTQADWVNTDMDTVQFGQVHIS